MNRPAFIRWRNFGDFAAEPFRTTFSSGTPDWPENVTQSAGFTDLATLSLRFETVSSSSSARSAKTHISRVKITVAAIFLNLRRFIVIV